MGLALLLTTSCGGDGGKKASFADAGTPIDVPAPSCEAAGGSETVATPVLVTSIVDRFHEGWLASPTVIDLDGDGQAEVVLARAGRLSVWHADASEVWHADVDGRIWSSPVVADLLSASPGLEIAIASRDSITIFDAQGSVAPGYPFVWRDELRTLAAGDIDGDGRLELVAVTNSRLEANGQRDIIIAIEAEGAYIRTARASMAGRSHFTQRASSAVFGILITPTWWRRPIR